MVGNLPAAPRSACQRLVQARLASFMSQYQVSVRVRPCAVCKPSALTSLANTSKPGELLPALDDAEFGALLDRVDGVAAGIGQADDLGLGRLRLQQERREVVGVERMANLAEHLAAVLLDRRHGVALERVTEGIVGGEEEPGVAAGLHQRLAGAVGQHPGVIGPVDGVGVAFRPGEVGSRRAGDDEHLVLGGGDLAHRQRHAGVRRVDDQIDLVDVIPLVGKLRADIRLVLMIAGDEFDFDVRIGLGEVGDRQLGGGNRARLRRCRNKGSTCR